MVRLSLKVELLRTSCARPTGLSGSEFCQFENLKPYDPFENAHLIGLLGGWVGIFTFETRYVSKIGYDIFLSSATKEINF